MRPALTPAISGLIISLFLTACGGGSGGGDSLAGGGIGGTGTGTATGFGSIIVNELSEFQIDGNTTITVDGEPASESDLTIGMAVKYQIASDASADLRTGTALSIDADTQICGPVTQTHPLKVLAQDVIVTADTVLVDIKDNDPGNLAVGDVIDIYGYSDSNNVLHASRMELQIGGAPVWEITGVASAIVADSSFAIGVQSITLNGAVVRDCDAGFEAGDVVSVKATEIADFAPGDALDTVTDVECIPLGLPIPGNPITSVIPAEIEGLVNRQDSATEWVVNWQDVVIDANTVYVDGTAEDLFIGTKLEVEGRLDTTTNLLTAETIRFNQPRLRIEAPVASSAVTVGEGLQIMGITALATPLTDDEDGIIANGFPPGVAEQPLEVRGFVDGSGTLFATRVGASGSANPDDVSLRGPVANIAAPLFEVLGVTIDAGSATQLFDAAGNSITVDQFFDLISDSSHVQVEDGVFDGVSRINNGVMEIE